jgi:hypothetical protein
MVTAGVSVARGHACQVLVHRVLHVYAKPTQIRWALKAGPVYGLAAAVPASGGGALVAKLALLSALVAVAFVATGELDADERRHLLAALPRRRLMRAESE